VAGAEVALPKEQAILLKCGELQGEHFHHVGTVGHNLAGQLHPAPTIQ